jgi:hypothetical protein
MTGYQTQSNGLIAYKKQSGLGTPASGAERQPAPHRRRQRHQAVQSRGGVERGAQRWHVERGRHGTQAIAASYTCEMSLGSHDPIIEAIMRSTWDSTALTKTQADFTSLTTGANTINLTSGNPITMGYRVGDVIRATVCRMSPTTRKTSASRR